MKKVLILSGSPRKGGNSDLLCDEFARGAEENGNAVEKIRVTEKKISPCLGCYYCREHEGKCVMQDDMAELLQKIIDCDVLVLSSPVYFYSICAQLKGVIDRTVARWTEIKDKDFYYIATAAEDEEDTLDITLSCFHGFALCFDGITEKGVIRGGGVHEKGEIKTKPALLSSAYEMGKSVS